MKRKLKIFCLTVALLMLLCALCSCGIIKGATVMEYDGYVITEAMYSYWASRYKASFINNYGEIKNGVKTVDWDKQLPDGSTYAGFFEEVLLKPYARKVLVCMKLFDEYGLDFDAETESSVSERLEGLLSLYGGKKELNAYLADYGLNYKTLERIYYAEAKVGIVTDYIFESGGPYEITTAHKSEYYEANYICVNWIYIYTERKPAPATEGTAADGSYIMVDMTDEEKQQKKQLVADIVAKIESGEKSFAELKKDFCEDKYADGTSKYDYLPNGFNLSANDYPSYGVELIQTIQDMEIGDVTTYTDEYGGTRIIVRNKLIAYKDLTDQEKNYMVDFDAYVREEKWNGILENAGIKSFDEVIARYTAKSARPFTTLMI